MAIVISVCGGITFISIALLIMEIKMHEIEKDCEKEIEEIKKEEVKKNELKESLSSGNHTDDINNGLNLLCKHE